jgi:hypothetical protein
MKALRFERKTPSSLGRHRRPGGARSWRNTARSSTMSTSKFPTPTGAAHRVWRHGSDLPHKRCVVALLRTHRPFPFVMGHEVVGDLDDDARKLIGVALRHAASRRCAARAPRVHQPVQRIGSGHLEPAASGFCESTGGGVVGHGGAPRSCWPSPTTSDEAASHRAHGLRGARARHRHRRHRVHRCRCARCSRWRPRALRPARTSPSRRSTPSSAPAGARRRSGHRTQRAHSHPASTTGSLVVGEYHQRRQPSSTASEAKRLHRCVASTRRHGARGGMPGHLARPHRPWHASAQGLLRIHARRLRHCSNWCAGSTSIVSSRHLPLHRYEERSSTPTPVTWRSQIAFDATRNNRTISDATSKRAPRRLHCWTSTSRPRRSCSTTVKASASKLPAAAPACCTADPLVGLPDPDGHPRPLLHPIDCDPLPCCCVRA